MKNTSLPYPIVLLILLALAGLPGCRENTEKADAYGNFEANELIVGAEASGRLLAFSVEEGQTLAAGAVVGAIDSTQLVLRREQLRAGIRALAAKSPAIGAQLAVYERHLASSRQQLATLERERRRVENLLKSDAATPKQLDDLNAQIEAVQRQMDVIGEQRSATGATLSTQRGGLLAEGLPLQKQIAQLDDQIARCRLVNPQPGTVLVRYAEPGEVVGYARPLYKLADLDRMTLRAYVGGDQLGQLKLGQTVEVLIDAPEGAQKGYAGTVRWISPQAEFTPKVIQTRDERVNLVYAFKVEVANDGGLKIGMPAEVRLAGQTTTAGQD
jgi:HlyD family secretion protein